MIARLFGVACGALLLAACGHVRSAAEPAVEPSARSADQVDFSCQRDADCAVKDVGNCCGYYPACVNRESPTFPEQVKAACARDGAMSVCGFPSISHCVCREERCEAVTGPAGEAEVR